MSTHAFRAHARFGASSAHRWFACPGSVRACDGVPDVPSEAALEGTRAHELLEISLRVYNKELSHGADQEKWDAAPDDMKDAVTTAFDYIQGLLDDYPDAIMLVEHRFEIPIASAPGEVFGTNDVCVFVPSLRLLYVIDYKHGAGTYVEVKGNKQLRFYALGALASLPNGPVTRIHDEIQLNFDTVAMIIIQPRLAWAEPVREEWVSVEDVLSFGKEIGEAVARCKDPDAPLVPGEEQCHFCPVRTSCPARSKLLVDDSFGGVEAVRDGTLPNPTWLKEERLAELMRIRAQALAFFNDVEDEVRRRLEGGRSVPGVKLVEAQARRQWADDNVQRSADALATILCPGGADNTNVSEQFKVEKLRTLTEVEAILKKDADRKEARRRLDAMAFLTTKKSSGALKVVPDADPRPAVNRAGVAFGGVKQIEHGQTTEDKR